MTRLGILASGRGSNFVAIERACRMGRVAATPSVVISNRADAPVLEKARRTGVEAVSIPFPQDDPEAFERPAVQILKKRGCDWILLAGFMRILSPYFLAAFPERILNIHPSLLPAFPGLHAQRRALEAGVDQTGCTVHFVTEEVDAGPIVDQITVPIFPGDTEESLSARILQREHELYPRAIKKLVES